MIDDTFPSTAHGADASDRDVFEQRLRSSLCAPIHHTPGDFGLDQIWSALDAQERQQRRALRRRRVLRWVAILKRSVLGLVAADRAA